MLFVACREKHELRTAVPFMPLAAFAWSGECCAIFVLDGKGNQAVDSSCACLRAEASHNIETSTKRTRVILMKFIYN